MDTKVVILVNSNRLVLHTCNSTQNFMVLGKYLEEFAANVLVPFFEQKIEESRGKIIKLNDNIKATFESSKMIKRPLKTRNCPLFNFQSSTHVNLKVKSCHTKPHIQTPKSKKLQETSGSLRKHVTYISNGVNKVSNKLCK